MGRVAITRLNDIGVGITEESALLTNGIFFSESPHADSQYDSFALLPLAEVDFSVPSTTGTVTVKSSGGDHTTLQDAWDSLSTRTENTEIVVDAGYDAGSLVMGAQTGDGTYWTIIRSSASASLTRHKRVGPSDKSNMFQHVTSGGYEITDSGVVKRVRFIGMSIETANGVTTSYHVLLDNLCEYVIFDRCLFDGNYTNAQTGIGLGLNGKHVGVIDCYIEDINRNSYESKALLIIKGSGPYAFVNNFLEAGSISVLFGGASPGSWDDLPQDITFARNYCYRRPSWRSDGNVACKNSFEIKHGLRFLVEHNALENAWDDAQAFMVNIKSVDGYGALGYANDVTFRYNTLENYDSGINLAAQPVNQETGLSAPFPLENVSVHDNEATSGGFDNPYWDGPSERALQFTGNIDGLNFSNNDLRGDFSNQMVLEGGPFENMIWKDNIVGVSQYGFSNCWLLDTLAPGHTTTGNILEPATWNTLMPSGNCITWPPPSALCPNAGVQTSRHANTKTGDFTSDPWTS